MGKPKRLKVAIMTFTAALGSGLIMQYGDAVASRWGVDSPITGPGTRGAVADMPLIPVSASAAAPQLRSAPGIITPRVIEVSLTQPEETDSVPMMDLPAGFERASLSLDLDDSFDDVAAPVLVAPTDEIRMPDFETIVADAPNCDVSFQAVAAALAHVRLTLDARCHAEMPVVIHHQGMMFHAITDAVGHLDVEVPALAEEAFFIAAFDDGEGAVAITGVPELALFDRAVLQWQGETGVQLHAREFGAEYDTDGHVWSGSAGTFSAAIAGEGGILTRLGNANAPEPLMAEIYTFPSGNVSSDGDVLLSVEAEVTAQNCGRDVAAQTIQIAPGQEPVATDLTLTMPDCDAVGEFLVLNNMIEDLTLAAK